MHFKLAILVVITFVLAFLFVEASLPASYGGEYRSSWTYVDATPFSGGYGECVAGDGRYIYVLRQYSSSSSLYWIRYDPVSDTWYSLNSSVSTDFKNGVAIAYDYSGNFYVLTGSAYKDGYERRVFYRYNVSTDSWTRLSDTPHVQGAGDAIVYSGYDGMIYSFIGRAEYTGDYTPDVPGVFARYDPGRNVWTNLTYPPWEGTDDGSSLAWTGGRYIYAMQGEFDETEPNRNFARYDILTDSWENLSDVPTQDGVGDGGSLLWIGMYDQNYSNVIFALDGNGARETPGYNFTVYYTNNDTWVKKTSLPAPVGYYVGNRLAYARGRIYYWQGAPTSWDGGGDDLYSLDYRDIYVPEMNTPLIALLIAIPVAIFAKKS